MRPNTSVLTYAGFIILTIIALMPDGTRHTAAEMQTEDREAESDIESAYREMGDAISGCVISVDSESGIIVVRNEDIGAETHRYTVRPDTEFIGAERLSDIASGDTVRIDFYIFRGVRIATGIILQKKYHSEKELSADENPLPPDLESNENGRKEISASRENVPSDLMDRGE